MMTADVDGLAKELRDIWGIDLGGAVPHLVAAAGSLLAAGVNRGDVAELIARAAISVGGRDDTCVEQVAGTVAGHLFASEQYARR